jgi:hypothetical protein
MQALSIRRAAAFLFEALAVVALRPSCDGASTAPSTDLIRESSLLHPFNCFNRTQEYSCTSS